MKQNNRLFLWFILGIGSELQVLFSLSITELLLLVMTPFLLFTEISHMRRNGVISFFWMSVLLFCGCIMSLLVNHSESYQVIRGVSITSIMVCAVVVSHYMLRKDPDGLKWFFIGNMISGLLCIFIFQRSVEVYMAKGADVDSLMSGVLFWVDRLSLVLLAPVRAFYLKIPLVYSVIAPIFLAFFSILTTASGRAASLSFFGASAIVMIGRKKRKSMMSLGRHFMLFFFASIVGIFVVKAAYQWAAMNNYLGEAARTKYEIQTAGGNGIVQLIIGGRADAFIGLLAIADSPIFGKGYWARDKKEDYTAIFLSRYGNREDYENYKARMAYYHKKGRVYDYGIPCHSHITSFWLWYGLPGLLFWLYVIFVIFRYLRKDVAAVPHWYYWLAAGAPALMWHIFFSPFHDRVALPLLVVGMLMARAVRLGKYQLPWKMIQEIEEAERC